MLKGIDVSAHQGYINWSKVKPNIDFAVLRAGYGKNNIDKCFHQNAQACTNNGIPFGVYWFSYALTPDMARKEAEYCIAAISKYKVDYPVCFDYEYDSYNYAVKQGQAPSKNTLISIAKAFLARVEELGYYAMNYTNIDYLSKGFSSLVDRYDTWLAQWSVSTPTRRCGIWQYSASGRVSGIDGNVDMDIAYNNYKEIITNLGLNKHKEETKPDYSEKEKTYYEKTKDYFNKALEVIDGKYGVETERFNKLKQEGYNPDIVQSIVNYILS